MHDHGIDFGTLRHGQRIPNRGAHAVRSDLRAVARRQWTVSIVAVAVLCTVGAAIEASRHLGGSIPQLRAERPTTPVTTTVRLVPSTALRAGL